MDCVCFGGVSTVQSWSFHPTSMPEDFSTWGFGSSIPSTARSQRDLRWICLRTKWQVTCQSPHAIQRACGFHSGSLSWPGWSGPALRREEHSQTLLPRRWTYGVATIQEAMSVPFMRSIQSMTLWPIWWWWSRGWFSPLKKKNTLTLKSPSSSLFSLCSFLNLAEFTTYIWFCALFFCHLSTS